MVGVRTPHRGLTEVPGGLRGGAGRPGVRFQGGETQPPPPTAHRSRLQVSGVPKLLVRRRHRYLAGCQGRRQGTFIEPVTQLETHLKILTCVMVFFMESFQSLLFRVTTVALGEGVQLP